MLHRRSQALPPLHRSVPQSFETNRFAHFRASGAQPRTTRCRKSARKILAIANMWQTNAIPAGNFARHRVRIRLFQTDRAGDAPPLFGRMILRERQRSLG